MKQYCYISSSASGMLSASLPLLAQEDLRILSVVKSRSNGRNGRVKPYRRCVRTSSGGCSSSDTLAGPWRPPCRPTSPPLHPLNEAHHPEIRGLAGGQQGVIIQFRMVMWSSTMVIWSTGHALGVELMLGLRVDVRTDTVDPAPEVVGR
eukprot:1186135-Prorocentrum_minimum.AAC.1